MLKLIKLIIRYYRKIVETVLSSSREMSVIGLIMGSPVLEHSYVSAKQAVQKRRVLSEKAEPQSGLGFACGTAYVCHKDTYYNFIYCLGSFLP